MCPQRGGGGQRHWQCIPLWDLSYWPPLHFALTYVCRRVSLIRRHWLKESTTSLKLHQSRQPLLRGGESFSPNNPPSGGPFNLWEGTAPPPPRTWWFRLAYFGANIFLDLCRCWLVIYSTIWTNRAVMWPFISELWQPFQPVFGWQIIVGVIQRLNAILAQFDEFWPLFS